MRILSQSVVCCFVLLTVVFALQNYWSFIGFHLSIGGLGTWPIGVLFSNLSPVSINSTVFFTFSSMSLLFPHPCTQTRSLSTGRPTERHCLWWSSTENEYIAIPLRPKQHYYRSIKLLFKTKFKLKIYEKLMSLWNLQRHWSLACLLHIDLSFIWKIVFILFYILMIAKDLLLVSL